MKLKTNIKHGVKAQGAHKGIERLDNSIVYGFSSTSASKYEQPA